MAEILPKDNIKWALIKLNTGDDDGNGNNDGENLLLENNKSNASKINTYIYILILRKLTPSVHLLANSKGNHVTGKKPLAAA
jgi:hypothetical protein